MYGWLVYNSALTSPGFMEMYLWYQNTANKKGIQLDLITNVEILSLICGNDLVLSYDNNNSKPEFVLFLDKDIRLAKTLELQGIKLYNSMETIQICDDKSLTFQALANKNISMPKTLIAPGTITTSRVKSQTLET